MTPSGICKRNTALHRRITLTRVETVDAGADDVELGGCGGGGAVDTTLVVPPGGALFAANAVAELRISGGAFIDPVVALGADSVVFAVAVGGAIPFRCANSLSSSANFESLSLLFRATSSTRCINKSQTQSA